MSFQLNYEGPSLNDYHSALKAWERAQTWRGETGEFDRRKLDGRKRHVTIRKCRNDDIACELHRTDVVTYCPDGVIKVERWASMSTDSFANALLPNGMSSTFNSNGCDIWIRPEDSSRYHWGDDWIGWKFRDSECSFKRSDGEYMFEPVDPAQTECIEHVTLDKQAGAAARKKYHWHDMKAWFNAFTAMAKNPVVLKIVKHDHGSICAAMLDQRYTDLFEVVDHPIGQSYDPLYDIKVAIYRATDAVMTTELPFIIGMKTERNILASSARW